MSSNKREIIFIHIGKAGCKIGDSFWDLLCSKFNIDSDGFISSKENTELDTKVFFEESVTKKFVPRSVFIDADPNSLNEIKKEKLKNLYDFDFFVSGSEETSKKFFGGYFESSSKIVDESLEKIRECAEQCSNLEGFIITRSHGGSTGSGIGSSILQRLSVNYGRKIKCEISLYPNDDLANHESLYSVLSTHCSLEHVDIGMCLDNNSLKSICRNNLEISNPNLNDHNKLVSCLMSSITNPIIHDGDLNGSLVDMLKNLVIYPRIHFIVPSLAPILSKSKFKSNIFDTEALTKSLFLKENQFTDIDFNVGKHISCYLSYQGPDFSLFDINNTITKLQNEKIVKLLNYSSDSFKVCLNSYSPFLNGIVSQTKNSILLLSNTTSISQMFAKINKNFDTFIEAEKNAQLNSEWKSELYEFRQDTDALELDYEEISSETVNLDGNQNETENDDD